MKCVIFVGDTRTGKSSALKDLTGDPQSSVVKATSAAPQPPRSRSSSLYLLNYHHPISSWARLDVEITAFRYLLMRLENKSSLPSSTFSLPSNVIPSKEQWLLNHSEVTHIDFQILSNSSLKSSEISQASQSSFWEQKLIAKIKMR